MSGKTLTMSCTFSQDVDFGPVVDPCRRPFDFTLVFEEAVLTLLPSVLGCVGAITVAFALVRRERRRDVITTQWVRAGKLGWGIMVLLVQVAVGVVAATLDPSITKTHLTVIAGAFSSLLALLMLAVSYLGTSRSYRPSTTIVAYHGFLLLAEAVRCRTYFLLHVYPIGILLVCSVALRTVLLVLESLHKKTMSPKFTISSEERAGIVNRSFFQWLVPLLVRGYHHHLTCHDLHPVDSVMYSASLETKFAPLLQPAALLERGRLGSGGQESGGRLQPKPEAKTLVRQTLSCLGYDVLYPVAPRLALMAFKIAQLFVVRRLLEYLQHGVASPPSHGYGLLGAVAFTYVGVSVVIGWYYHQVYRCSSIARGGLVLAIFSKILRLREDAETESRAMTLMVSDVQRISMGFVYLHEVWAAVFELAIFTYLLQDSMGLSSLSVLGLAAACMMATSVISKITSQQQQVWLKAVQTRLAATQNMLSSLKAIKMMGMEKRVAGLVGGLRADEMAAAKLFRTLLAVSAMLSYATLTLSPLLVFGAYLGVTGLDSTSVDATQMFTCLVLIILLASPLIHLFQALPTLGAAYGCFQRLQQFLALEEHEPQLLLAAAASRRTAAVAGKAGEDSDVLISVKNASFGYLPDEPPILRHVHLDIKKGKMIAILGAIGTGKSLLLRSILGEGHPPLLNDGGRLEMRTDSVAYCSQEPWLENMSAKANWTRHAHGRDARWMAKVAHACALDDIIALPDYTSGTVGSGGSRLSGGQRQRLALARALVLQKDILILDDIFSALDPATKSTITQRLLGRDGLARSQGRTVVFTTHDRSLADLSDEAYEIDSHGNLASVAMTLEQDRVTYNQSEEQQPYSVVDFNNDTIPAFETIATKSGENDTNETIVIRSDSSRSSARTTGDDTEKQTKSETMRDREVYMAYARSMGLPHALVFLVAGIGFSVTLKLPDLWVKWWSDALSSTHHRPNAYWLGIYGLLTTSPLLVLALWVLHLMLAVAPISGIKLHSELLDRVLGAAFPHISRVDTGQLVNRFNQDLMFVDTQLPMALFNTSAELFIGLVQIILVAVASLQALSVIPPLFAVLYLIQRFYLRTSKRLRLLELETKGDLHRHFAETTAGITTIRAHKWTAQAHERFAESLDRSQEPFYLLYSVQRWLQLVMDLVVAGLVLVVAGVAVGLNNNHKTAQHGGGVVTVGAIGVALTNATSLGQTLTNLIISWTSLETTLGAVARITLFKRETRREGTPTRETGHQQQDHLDAEKLAPVFPPAQLGTVHLTNVWASYSPRPLDDNAMPASPRLSGTTEDVVVWSLRGISATFHPGSKTAICGPTGSGKSTVLLTILGMVDTSSSSSIIIDGVSSSNLTPRALRERFDVISQDYFTCADTLRDELDPERDFSDAEVANVLEECGLWEKLVAAQVTAAAVAAAAGETAQPEQVLHTPRQDLNLSAGEIQLLSLARVILRASHHPRGILLLDEATSSVDAETDARIHRLLFEKLGQKTVLAVVHRPDTALRFGEIVVMEEGRIVDRGEAGDVVRRCALFGRVARVK